MKISGICYKFFWAGIVLSIVSFGAKDRLPGPSAICPEVYQEPRQTQATMSEFTVKAQGLTYSVRPRYAYELYGLVVSCHSSASWDDYYHAQWQDRFNTKDIAVIWGSNVRDDIYQHYAFSSGSWTAYFKPRPGVPETVWFRFDHACYSNNHLVAVDPEVHRMILGLRRGDQVHIRGHLVDYGKDERIQDRQTSVVRTDTGCEVILVEKIDFLRRSPWGWRWLWFFSLGLTAVSFLLGLVSLGSELRRRKELLEEDAWKK